jgi:hypothetical protein
VKGSGSGPDDSAFGLAGFDRYVEEHGIPEEDWPAAFARWIAEVTGGPVPNSRRSSGRRWRTES